MNEVYRVGKNLVIVESPAKAKTIGKFLGKNYTVKASVGHLRDLPKSKLGVNTENNFEPEYITIRGKGPVVTEIKKEAKKADKVFLATDPDREGEAISWHLSHLLGINENEPVRIEFNEITKDAIKKAIKTPRAIDRDLVDAQQARRVLDRLVGYKLSPILWFKIRKGLSAGRVQSVATKIICQREREIEAFVPREYWEIALTALSDHKEKVLFKFHGNRKGKMELADQKSVDKILKELKGKKLLIEKIENKEKRRQAYKPFITSSLQQEAANKLGFATKKTMMLAQQLYEGVEIAGRGSIGLITYIRTDSIRISEEAQEAGKAYILSTYGKNYFKKYSFSQKNKKKIQDAHECIRPSYVELNPHEVENSLTKDQYKLYKLIWERFLSSMMADAVYDAQSVNASIDNYIFRTSGSKLKFDGFMRVYTYAGQEDLILPEMEEESVLDVKKIEPSQHFTQPPARYTEASLVKALEELNIGRPSTYSPTISTIMQREYVKKTGSALMPTELGFIVTDLMEENFKQIMDLDFTAEMEGKLDLVEDGDIEWHQLIREFYQPFEKAVTEATENIEKIVLEEETDEICDVCGSPMVVKFGRFGKFLACKNYPECKGTKPLLEKIGVHCPLCDDGEVILRKSKKGKLFYGCSKFPSCHFVSWKEPTGENCPVCGKILVRVKSKNKETIECSDKQCPHNRSEKKKPAKKKK